MNTNKKMWAALAIFATALASTSTQAATLSFGGALAHQVDIDTSATVAAGKTSSVAGYIDPTTNTVIGTNVFLETFDAYATGKNSIGANTRPNAGPNTTAIQYGGPNGGFTSLNPNDPGNSGDLTITNGGGQGMGIRKGTAGYAAAPGSDCTTAPCDQTYFAYGPGQGGALPTSVNVSYSALLAAYNPGSRIDYLGIYFGSVDTYNEIEFFDKNGMLIHGTGVLGDGILTGTEILNAMGCANASTCSGHQSGDNSNVYVNLAFGSTDQFSSFSFVTTGVAFEIDNVVTHVDAAPGGQVPEPASLLLFGLGLLGLAGLRRKSK